jgi:hypothetical protein
MDESSGSKHCPQLPFRSSNLTRDLYKKPISVTREALLRSSVDEKRFNLFLQQLEGACENARTYRDQDQRILREKRRQGQSDKELAPVSRAIWQLTKYLNDHPQISDRQVQMAALLSEVMLQGPSEGSGFSALLARFLTEFRNQVDDRTGRSHPAGRQIGNLLYPAPPEAEDDPDAESTTPTAPPDIETMLAFELALRFRYWSSGQGLVEFETGDDAFNMPAGGNPRYWLVSEWVEAALGETVGAESIKKRLEKMRARSAVQLTSWPVDPQPLTYRLQRPPRNRQKRQ